MMLPTQRRQQVIGKQVRRGRQGLWSAQDRRSPLAIDAAAVMAISPTGRAA